MRVFAPESGTAPYYVRQLVAVLCSLLLLPGEGLLLAQAPAPAAAAPEAVKLPNDQLDALVSPIALYPDPMLSQTLVASTYPLEVIQLQQWLDMNKGLKDKALADAVAKQNWDPSIQGLAALPDVVKRLSENIKWTSELGNAFLAQQSDVMDAVQRMRKKASDTGNLKSNEQQKVETKVIETKTVIVVEQANPQVVYVPSYNPVVVYGPPVYPYPPVVYPPVGYVAAGMAISFGVGIAMGAMWGGGWGYGCGWHGGGGNTININNNNNFNRNTNINGGNRNTINGGNRVNGGNSTWQHNPSHRGGAPYGDRSTASKFGGTARGDSLSSRQTSARQNQARGGTGSLGGGPSAGTSDRGGRSGSGGLGGCPSAGTSNRDSSSGNFSGGSGGDRVGNRQVSSGTRDSSAFGGSSGRSSGSGAAASSSRGSSSMGGSSRGGGGGGGSRGGGGGRRR